MRSFAVRELGVRTCVLLLSVVLVLAGGIAARSENNIANTEFPWVKCALTGIARDERTLTAYFIFTAQASSRVSGTCYPDGRCDPYDLGEAYLLAGGQRYEVVTDSQGSPVASKLESPYAQHNIGPESPIHVYVTFVAPPRRIRVVTICLPDVDPFRNITISRVSSTIIFVSYSALATAAFILGMLFQSLVGRRPPFSAGDIVTILKYHRGKIFITGISVLVGLFSFLYIESIVSLWAFSFFIRGLVTCALFLIIYLAYKRGVVRLESALIAVVGILAAIIWSFTVYP